MTWMNFQSICESYSLLDFFIYIVPGIDLYMVHKILAWTFFVSYRRASIITIKIDDTSTRWSWLQNHQSFVLYNVFTIWYSIFYNCGVPSKEIFPSVIGMNFHASSICSHAMNLWCEVQHNRYIDIMWPHYWACILLIIFISFQIRKNIALTKERR